MIKFLRGLDEQYSVVRSQIMLMEPLQDLAKVFFMLIQQERQLNSQDEEAKIMFSTSDVGGRGRGYRGKGGKLSWKM